MKTHHYFSQDEKTQSKPKAFTYTYKTKTFTFITDTGVFSAKKVDSATDTLLNNIPPLEGSLLDMGCGYGPIGIVLAKEYNLQLTQADINPRAVRLAIANAALNNVSSKVIQSDGFSNIKEQFNTIVINPPIHAGKSIIFNMYEKSYQHLLPGGSLYVVILKKHGAESSIKRLNENFGNCNIIYKKKGCFLLMAKKQKFNAVFDAL